MANPVDIKLAVIAAVNRSLLAAGFGDTPVVYGLPDGTTLAGQEGWVSVNGVTASVDTWQTAETLDRYRVDWQIQVLVGSGYNTDPVEAERHVFDLAVRAALGLEEDHTLGLSNSGVESASLSGFRSVVDWAQDNDNRQTVVELIYSVRTEGVS